MEQSEILARFAKAREFEKTTANGWKFQLRLPTEFSVRRFAMEAKEGSAGGASQIWLREMLQAAVIGWTGPTLDDLLHEGDKTPLAYSPQLIGPLLESDLDLLDELGAAVHSERADRLKKQEESAKNSASV